MLLLSLLVYSLLIHAVEVRFDIRSDSIHIIEYAWRKRITILVRLPFYESTGTVCLALV